MQPSSRTAIAGQRLGQAQESKHLNNNADIFRQPGEPLVEELKRSDDVVRLPGTAYFCPTEECPYPLMMWAVPASGAAIVCSVTVRQLYPGDDTWTF